MGKPKPLLSFNGESCLSLVLRACVQSRAGETILVLGSEADAIRAEAERRFGGTLPSSVSIVVNERHEQGQTSSVKAGLEAASPRTDAFALLPVDHPLVTHNDLDALIERFEARPRGRTLFIASYEGERGHPTLFNVSHRSPILEMGDDEPLNEYVRLREGESLLVRVDNPGVVSGMNTPEEYQRLLEMYHSRPAREPGALT